MSQPTSVNFRRFVHRSPASPDHEFQLPPRRLLPRSWRHAIGALTATVVLLTSLLGAAPSLSHVSAAQTAAPAFTVTDLGSLPDGGWSIAYGLNAAGDVVGVAGTAGGARHAFVWEGGAMTDLGTLPGGTLSEAVGINATGHVVGTSTTTTSGLLGGVGTHAVLWDNGVATDLGTLGGDISWASGINDAGQVVGWSDTAEGQEHAFLWEGGTMTDLGTINGGGSSRAFAINQSGQVVGRTNTAAGQNFEGAGTHGFLWEEGQFTDLGTLPGGDYSEATGINSAGHVVGVSNTAPGAGLRDQGVLAFLWDGETMTDLGFLEDPGSSASGINDAGQVVGWDICDCGDFALLWDAGETIDLRTAAGDDSLTHLYGINTSGQIAGYGFREGEEHAILLTRAVTIAQIGPTPSPTSTGLELGPTPTPTVPAQTGVVGNSYLGPLHGVGLSWDDSWSVVSQASSDGTDQLVLTNGTSLIEFDAGFAPGLTVESCVDQSSQALAANAGLSDLTVGLDANGQPLSGTDPSRSYTVYTATLTSTSQVGTAGTAVAFYIECRQVTQGILLVVIDAVPVADFNAEIPALQALLGNLVFP